MLMISVSENLLVESEWFSTVLPHVYVTIADFDSPVYAL
jgi:hypothetical protein